MPLAGVPRTTEEREATIDEEHGQSGRGEPAQRTLGVGYFLPGLARLRGYGLDAGRGDAIAGAVVAVLLVPQAVAYAQLAGLPPAAGLYASMLPLLVYAFMGARASISIGPVALVSLLVADTVAAGGGELDTARAATLLSAMVGLILFVAGLSRLGFLVRFVSNPVIKGFTAAAAILIAASQLGSVLGLSLERGGLPATLGSLFGQLGDVHLPTLAVSAAALAGFLLGGRPFVGLLRRTMGEGPWFLVLSKSAPLAVIVVVIAVFASSGMGERLGIDMVGALDSGVPTLTPPPLDPGAALAMLPSAFAIAAIVFVVATGIASSVGGGRGERTTPDREAIALGAANVVSALSGGYAVGASFSRSALAAGAGAATAFTLGVTALLVLLVVLLAGEAFAFLPRGVLGALIISAVWSLIDTDTIRRVWRFDRAEAATLFLTAFAVLFGGLQVGIATGALAGIALYLHGTSRPRVTIEGRLEGEDAFRSVARGDVRESDDDRLVVRVDESLYFANSDHVKRCVADALAEREGVARVLLDMKSVDDIDFTALQMLGTLLDELEARDVTLRFVGAKAHVREALERFGLAERCGEGTWHYATEAEALGEGPVRRSARSEEDRGHEAGIEDTGSR